MLIEIGGIPIKVCSAEPDLLETVAPRFSAFVTCAPSAVPFVLEVREAPVGALCGASQQSPSDPPLTRVAYVNGKWLLEREDACAEWRLETGRGMACITKTPYSLDTILRILHTLLLVPQGGFLLHASSVIRNGRAFVFSGVSGSGKTTLSRLAPPDTTLLSDEISYIRPVAGEYRAFGTPFAGELGRAGENVSAPIAGAFLLAQGTENQITPLSQRDAVARLLRNILFFSSDRGLVRPVFEAACEFAARVPVGRLTFAPSSAVWELIR